MKPAQHTWMRNFYCEIGCLSQFAIVATFGIVPLSVNAAALNYNDDFNNGQRNEWFSIIRDNPGYDAVESSGALRMTKQSGVATAGIYYRPAFELLGDLSVQVDCSRISGDTSVGINVSAGTGSVSIYYTTSSGVKVYGSRCGAGGCSSAGQASPPSSAPFRIRRENGSRLVAEYRLNGAWEVMVLQDDSTGPARVQLFMIQESGLTSASVATFDNLNIQAPDYIDLRQSIANAPTISRAIQMCWKTEFNKVYQPQWRAKVEGVETWNNLGNVIVGSGGTDCVFDPEGSEDKRFYRVLVTP